MRGGRGTGRSGVKSPRPLALLVSLLALTAPARAEVCTYEGDASYGGHVLVRTEASTAGGVLSLRVTGRLTASPWRLWNVEYFGDEITTWRDGVLRGIAANSRYLVNGGVKRQQWDVWKPEAGGLEASRAQAKREREFHTRYPSFAVHWPIAAFGRDWLPGFAAAPPERRPDLDLPHPNPALRTPLALAFYWIRFLPPGTSSVPVFLPGFKRDALVTEPLRYEGAAWHMPLHHPALGDQSSATAVIEGTMLRWLSIEAHETLGNGVAAVTLMGCSG